MLNIGRTIIEMKGYATEAGALKKLSDVCGEMKLDNSVRMIIAQDGRFIPAVVLRGTDLVNLCYLAHNGVYCIG